MEETMREKKISTKQMAFVALMAAVICILAPISIPIGPVPISLTNLVLYFTIYLIGTKSAVCSYIIYLLLGTVGLPVFSGFTGGVGKLIGPTGGYLIGFIPMIIIAGIIIEHSHDNKIIEMIGMILATAVCYLIGTLYLSYSTNMSFKAALIAGVLPFIAEDIIKMIIAMILGRKVKSRLKILGSVGD